MVRQESVAQFEQYIKEVLSRHYVTINGIEIDKNYVFEIKSLDKAKLFKLVICDNIEYAAELVCAIDKSDPQENFYSCWLNKFLEQSKNLNINPNQPVGIDILVF